MCCDGGGVFVDLERNKARSRIVRAKGKERKKWHTEAMTSSRLGAGKSVEITSSISGIQR
jgi:hypothetical protein